MKRRPVVGVLAFQGDFAKHQRAFEKLNCKVDLVKSTSELDQVDCLVIPGGESSVMTRFILSQGMTEPIKEFAKSKPIWGTCAGMILLAKEIDNDSRILALNLLDVVVSRNAYGRQYESFIDEGEFTVGGKSEKMEMVFIRAPKVVSVNNGVEVLGKCRGEITIVQQGNVIATAFHPELTDSTRFQEYFLSLMP